MTQISPKSSGQNNMNDSNTKQYTNPPNGYSTSSTTSEGDELSDTQTSESTLLSSQVEQQIKNSGSYRHDESALHSSPAIKQSSFWGGMRLRTKAMLAAIAIGTIPVVAVGTIAYRIADQQLVKQIQQDKIDSAEALDNEVLRFLVERYGDIQVLASLPILRNPQVREIVPLQQKEAVLDNFQQVHGVYDSIAAYDLNGDLIIESSQAEKAPGNIKKRDYFQAVLKTDKPFISDLQISKVTVEPVIFFAAPIIDVLTGKTIGVVRTRMPVKSMDKLFKNYAKGSNEFLLVDSNGKVFAAKEEDDIGKDAKSLFASYPKLAVARQQSVQRETNLLDKNEHLFAYAPFEKLEGLPDLNWSSIITQPQTMLMHRSA